MTIVIDFIHVLEYLWKAAWCFHTEGDPAAEDWVRDQARRPAGKASTVAAAIRRKATRHGLDPSRRKSADTCAAYLTNKAPTWTTPPRCTTAGPSPPASSKAPAATSSKTAWTSPAPAGASTGAEAILKLRALRSNGDFDDYWPYHLTQERQRVHETRYRNGIIPQAA